MLASQSHFLNKTTKKVFTHVHTALCMHFYTSSAQSNSGFRWWVNGHYLIYLVCLSLINMFYMNNHLIWFYLFHLRVFINSLILFSIQCMEQKPFAQIGCHWMSITVPHAHTQSHLRAILLSPLTGRFLDNNFRGEKWTWTWAVRTKPWAQFLL